MRDGSPWFIKCAPKLTLFSVCPVVRLFNTILLSSTQAEEAKSHSTRLEAPEPLPDPKKKAGKDNILGRGSRNAEGSRVTKEGFEALLKGGGL